MRQANHVSGQSALVRRGLVLVLAMGVALGVIPAAAQNAAHSPSRLDWGSKAPIPTKRVDFGLAAAPNGKLYAVGGESEVSDDDVAAIEEYDPASNTWATK